MVRAVAIPFIFLLLAGSVVAQQSELVPESAPSIDLSRVTIASLDQTDDRVAVRLQTPEFREEVRTVTMRVTEIVPESRTRVVEKDGRRVEVAFTVAVPVVKEVEKLLTARVFVGMNEVMLMPDLLNVRDLAGRPIAKDVVLKRLQSPCHVIITPGPFSTDHSLDSFYRQVFKDDVMIFVVPIE